MPITRPYSLWNLRNYLWMTISEVRVKQICFPSTISNVTNDKNELWKTVSLASFQKPQLQSVSIFKFAIRFKPPFVFPVLFIPLFHVLSNHFEVPLSLVEVFTGWIYKFGDTAPWNSWTDCSAQQTPSTLMVSSAQVVGTSRLSGRVSMYISFWGLSEWLRRKD